MEFALSIALGLFMGLFSGFVPGIGASSTLLTFSVMLMAMSPLNAMICFIVMSISSQYVASVTAIYTGIPGADSAFPTAKESHNLKKWGLTKIATAQNALASVFGNTVGLILLLTMLPVASYIVSLFGAAIQLAIISAAILVVILTSDSTWKATLAILLAFGLKSLGQNPLTFEVNDLGLSFLERGLPWISLTMGAIIGHAVRELRTFEMAQVPLESSAGFKDGVRSVVNKIPSLLQGTIVGFFVGLIPGLSYILSSTVCYQLDLFLSRESKKTEQERVLSSLIASDAAHCSGSLAMLIPLLVFGIPINISEGIIYNIITLQTTTKALYGSLIENWWLVLIAIMITNVVSMFVAWRLGNRIVSLMKFPSKYLIAFIIATSTILIAWVEQDTSSSTLGMITFIIMFIVSYLSKMNPLPFIFGVLVWNLFQSLLYSNIQLYL